MINHLSFRHYNWLFHFNDFNDESVRHTARRFEICNKLTLVVCYGFQIAAQETMNVNTNRDRKQIISDREFHKAQEDHVTNAGRRFVTIGLEDDEVGYSGEDYLVGLAKRNPMMTLKDLELHLLGLGEPKSGPGLKYRNTLQQSPDSIQIPPMRVKIKGPRWNQDTARAQLCEYMTIEGYGQGGHRSYTKDEPDWWPENRDYFEWIKKVRNPGSATIRDIETLLPSCLAIRDH